MFGTFIAPSPEQDFVELGATRKGRLFKKHILNKGTLYHPKTGEAININDDFLGKLTSNFDAGVCDIVQVPLANDQNQHSEAPDRNIGRVTGLEVEGDKVYAIIDARKHADDLGETLLGASAMMSLDYTDTKDNTKKGPTLLHVAVTNRPYVTGLDEYSEVVAASAEYSLENTVVLTTTATAAAKEAKDMNAQELIDAIKGLSDDDRKAVVATFAPEPDKATADLTALTQTLKDTGLVQLTNGDTIGMGDVVNAIGQLARTNVELSSTVGDLTKDKAAAQVDALVKSGHIVPANRDTMLELRLSNEDMFNRLIPEKPLLALSVESGITPPDNTPALDIDAEIARYTEMYSS